MTTTHTAMRRLARQVVIKGVWAICVVALLAEYARCQGQPPTVALPGPTLVLRPVGGGVELVLLKPTETARPGDVEFGYCPRGRHVRENPQQRIADGKPYGETDGQPMGPYYISKWEVSRKLYYAVLKEGWTNEEWQNLPGVPGMRRRLEEEYENERNGFIEFDRELPREERIELPIYNISLNEAAYFVRGMQRMYDRARPHSLGLVRYRFRLPSVAEWGYACRGCQNPSEVNNFPHWNMWVKDDDLRKAEGQTIQKTCSELFSAVGSRTVPATSQAGMYMLLDHYREMTGGEAQRLRVSVLPYFYKRVTGADHNFKDLDLAKSTSNKTAITNRIRRVNKVPNRWGLFDFHGGVAEWAIEDATHWDRIERNDFQDLPRYTVGGHFFMDGREEFWKRFTIWHAEPVDKQCYDDPSRNDTLFAGVRVLVKTEFTDPKDALQVVRNRLIHNMPKNQDQARQVLAAYDQELMVYDQVIREMKADEAASLSSKLQYCRALLAHEAGDGENTKLALTKVATPGSEELVEILGYQLNRK